MNPGPLGPKARIIPLYHCPANNAKTFFLLLEKIHDVSRNKVIKLKGKRGQPGIETRDLSHPKTLSVNHTTRPLSRKQYRKFLFGSRQLTNFHDVSWNITAKLKVKREQPGIGTRDLPHPKTLSVNHTTRPLSPQAIQKVSFLCPTTRKISWRLLKLNFKVEREKGHPGFEPGTSRNSRP